jgi:hypothetical protein
MRPRRDCSPLGFVLMVINKVAGFVLPYSPRNSDRQRSHQGPDRNTAASGFSVLLATLIQGVTSFSLTQLLSKAAQRLIADLARAGAETHLAVCRWLSTMPTKREPWCRAS